MARGRKARGLGDSIEIFTEATGIKKAVQIFSDVTGIDCGCKERKEKLNKLFPFKSNCLTESQYNELKQLIKGNQFTSVQNVRFTQLFNEVFNEKKEVTTCTSCVITRVKQVRKLLKFYEDELNNI